MVKHGQQNMVNNRQKHGQRSPKHMVNSRQTTWSTVIKHMVGGVACTINILVIVLVLVMY
jgi:hypothetical protein